MAEIDEFTEALIQARSEAIHHAPAGAGFTELMHRGVLAVARVALERAAEVAEKSSTVVNGQPLADAIRALIPKDPTNAG